MRQYERGGVVVDQCGECRGICLDRGELDHLISAETQWSDRAPSGPPAYEERRYDQRPYDDDDDRRRGQRPYDDKYRHKKKRKSFFEDLFDD
jgi:Zn-finger nucleic acid-binding protein